MSTRSVMSDSFVTPWTVVLHVPLSMEFSRQEYWSEFPFPTPRDLPHQGIKPTAPTSAALAGRFFTISATRDQPPTPRSPSIYYNLHCKCNIVSHYCLGCLNLIFRSSKKSHSFNYLPMVGYLDFTSIDSSGKYMCVIYFLHLKMCP